MCCQHRFYRKSGIFAGNTLWTSARWMNCSRWCSQESATYVSHAHSDFTRAEYNMYTRLQFGNYTQKHSACCVYFFCLAKRFATNVKSDSFLTAHSAENGLRMRTKELNSKHTSSTGVRVISRCTSSWVINTDFEGGLVRSSILLTGRVLTCARSHVSIRAKCKTWPSY